MSRLMAIIDAYKDLHGQPSDSSIARAIGVKPQTLSSWRKRGIKEPPDREALRRLARLAHVDYEHVVLRAALLDAGWIDDVPGEELPPADERAFVDELLRLAGGDAWIAIAAATVQSRAFPGSVPLGVLMELNSRVAGSPRQADPPPKTWPQTKFDLRIAMERNREGGDGDADTTAGGSAPTSTTGSGPTQPDYSLGARNTGRRPRNVEDDDLAPDPEGPEGGA